MKTKLLNVGMVLGAAFLLQTVSSCATLLAKKEAEVVLYGATRGLKVTENGSPVRVEQVQSHGKAAGESVITFYAPGIKLDRREDHTITLNDQGKSGTVVLESKVSGA